MRRRQIHDGDLVVYFNSKNRYLKQTTWSEAAPDGRWRAFINEELIPRDKVDLGAALAQFAKIAEVLEPGE